MPRRRRHNLSRQVLCEVIINLVGWSIRPLSKVGKTEILCSNESALRTLKAHAATIPSSDVYPSFSSEFSHTLFFFDVRPEFIQWLESYATACPAPREERPTPAVATTRRFRAGDLVAAAAALLLFAGLFLWLSPLVSRADVVEAPPPDEIVLPVQETPVEPTITITVTDSAPPEAGDSVPSETPVRSPVSTAPAAGQLKIWFVDVGQGDGIVIRLPRGQIVVVDANRGSEDAMNAVLTSIGCRSIKAMVLTHPHADHLGGLADLLERYPVETFYDAGVPHTTAGYLNLLRMIERGQADYVADLKPGDALEWDPSCRVTVLSAGAEAGEDLNNSSIVLRIEFGRASVLLTGDAEKEVEGRIVARFAGKIRSDVLKVGHHGSRSSSSPEFLREVAPKFAVISCGAGNTYGHPNPQTLRNLDAIGAKILRTDLLGTIQMISNGERFTVVSPR